MTHRITLFLAALLISMAALATSPYVVKNPIPERAPGQTHVVGLATEPIANVRIGVIGLGMRGSDGALRLSYVPGATVAAICDIEQQRADDTAAKLRERGVEPKVYAGDKDSWQQLCKDPDIDLVYIATDWLNHAPMAKLAMLEGKHVAIEVPAALNLDEIWDLINTSETTRRHCMMLENCVYDFFELNTLNMAQQGLFGEVLHTEGSYIHNLNDFWPLYWNNWRLDYNKRHRGDVYPTHGIGPACQLLDIHRGDRMTTLVAMDTKAVGGPEAEARLFGTADSTFANGDHTMTMIRTHNGKTIHIQHDVVNPRPYSRMYQLTGTRGFANKYPSPGYAFMPEQIAADSVPDHENLNAHGFISDAQREALTQKYMHPLIKEVGEMAKKVGGHGGMDFIMDYRLIYCLNHGLPLDMDVYDLAEWCAISPLSAISIENGNAPVEFPDFTRGHWRDTHGYRHAYKR